MADPGGVGARFVNSRVGRRSFLGGGLLALIAACGRRVCAASAQPAIATRYRALTRPVVVPLADLQSLWRARPFVADATTLASAAKPNAPIRISGTVVRTSESTEARSQQFSAVCLLCPHEHCDVDFVRDPRQLAADVVQEIGKPVTDPVYLCPCHNSTFTAAGDRLAGPAPRGLYRFRVTAVTDATVEIGEVEEDLLLFI
jgi:Rieske Fe-S protein